MKKRIWIGSIAACVILAAIVILALVLGRRQGENASDVVKEEHEAQTTGEWTRKELPVKITYGPYDQGMGLHVMTEEPVQWFPETAADPFYEITPASVINNTAIFAVKATKEGTGPLVLSSDQYKLTIMLAADEKGFFTFQDVTCEEKTFENASVEGYDILRNAFGAAEIPDEAQIALLDVDGPESTKASVLLNYGEAAIWYYISKEAPEQPVINDEIYAENDWSKIGWDVNGIHHVLVAEQGHEAELTALYDLLKQ